jgi:hypothetical protein
MVHGGDNVVRDFVIDFGEFPVGSVLPALDNCALISFFLSFFFFFLVNYFIKFWLKYNFSPKS